MTSRPGIKKITLAAVALACLSALASTTHAAEFWHGKIVTAGPRRHARVVPLAVNTVNGVPVSTVVGRTTMPIVRYPRRRRFLPAAYPYTYSPLVGPRILTSPMVPMTTMYTTPSGAGEMAILVVSP